MLTVKYIDLQGREYVFPAHEVRYDVNTPPDSLGGPATAHVWFERLPNSIPDGALSGVSCGTVFVMNEAGKTVATYRLGDPNAKGHAGPTGPIGGIVMVGGAQLGSLDPITIPRS